MNKKQAIEAIKKLSDDLLEVKFVSLESVIDIASRINEPQKVVVPKFVAEWIEYCKQRNLDLQDFLSRLKDGGEMIPERVDMMARAWLDGYEVEQEKLYTVANHHDFIKALLDGYEIEKEEEADE